MPTTITKDQVLAILTLDFIGLKKTQIASALGIQRSTVYNHLNDYSVQTDFLPSNLAVDATNRKTYQKLAQLINAGMSITSIYHLYQAHPPYFTSISEAKKAISLISKHHNKTPVSPEKAKHCLHCKQIFTPDCRHRHDQCFCSAVQCRIASKKHSQKKWVQTKGLNYWKTNSCQ